MNFETYMATINRLILSSCNMEVQDFPDEPFMDYYDDGLTCAEVVEIMENRNSNLEAYFE